MLNDIGGIDINIYDIEGITERRANPNAPQKRQAEILVSK